MSEMNRNKSETLSSLLPSTENKVFSNPPVQMYKLFVITYTYFGISKSNPITYTYKFIVERSMLCKTFEWIG